MLKRASRDTAGCLMPRARVTLLATMIAAGLAAASFTASASAASEARQAADSVPGIPACRQASRRPRRRPSRRCPSPPARMAVPEQLLAHLRHRPAVGRREPVDRLPLRRPWPARQPGRDRRQRESVLAGASATAASPIPKGRPTTTARTSSARPSAIPAAPPTGASTGTRSPTANVPIAEWTFSTESATPAAGQRLAGERRRELAGHPVRADRLRPARASCLKPPPASRSPAPNCTPK